MEPAPAQQEDWGVQQPLHVQEAAFQLAGSRLEQLLSDARDNRPDSLLDEVEGYTPDQRLTLLANGGALITVVTFVAAFLGHEDPLGGMSLSPASLEAAAWGVAFGLPLLVCSAAGHSRAAKEAFPVLGELHSEQRKLLAPLVTGMNVGQLGVLFGFVVVPCLLFLLPGFKARSAWPYNQLPDGLPDGHPLTALVGWDACESLLSDALLPPQALFSAAPAASAAAASATPRLPQELHALAPSVLSGWTAGFVVASCLSVRDWEMAAIRDALRSAERFFRLSISQSRGARGAGAAAAALDGAQAAAPPAPVPANSSELRSRSAAAAFRLVACCWLLERFQVSRLGFVLASLNIVFLCVGWQFTSNLATPAVAALLHCGAEAYFSSQEQRALDERTRDRARQLAERRGWRSEAEGGDDTGSRQ